MNNKYSIEDYQKAIQSRKPEQIDATQNTDDYYNALKNESYKSLLNSEVQASIARDQALKYTNNSLVAKGYANQGLAESTGLGIQSQYSNAIANAVNNYRSGIQDINTQQRNEQLANQKDDFESVTSLMSSASSKEQLDNVLKTYEYIGEDGKFSTEAFNNLDDRSKKQLQILYSMYNSQFDTPAPTTGTLNSLDALNNQTYVVQNSKKYKGTTSTLGEDFESEMKALYHYGASGTYQNGDTIKVTNDDDEVVYLQWNGNGFVMANENTYDSAPSKYTLTAGKKKSQEHKKV